MEVVDPFDSWVEYRSFVADQQRGLFERLRGQYERDEIDPVEGTDADCRIDTEALTVEESADELESALVARFSG